MQNLERLKPLKQLPRLEYLLSTNKRACLKYPSNIELLTLSSNLTYKAHLILTKQSKIKKGKRIEDYIKQSIQLHELLNNFANNFIDMREYNRIVKEFGLNRLND